MEIGNLFVDVVRSVEKEEMILETIYLLGIDTGASEMFSIYEQTTMFTNPHTLALTKQAQAILGGKIFNIETLKDWIKPQDIVVLGGQRIDYLKAAEKLNCFKVYLLEYAGQTVEEPQERWHLNISCDLSQSRKDWHHVINPFLVKKLEKLQGIQQPKNGRVLYCLQASDYPEDELKSIRSFKMLMEKYHDQFTEVVLKNHPNSELDLEHFIEDYNNSHPYINVKAWNGTYSLENFYREYQYLASHSSSMTLHGMLAGLSVFHCIDPITLEVKHFDDIMLVQKNYKIGRDLVKYCRVLDDMILYYWAKHQQIHIGI